MDKPTTGLIVNILHEYGCQPDNVTGFTGCSFRDLVQDCELYILKYKHSYDPAKGAWSTFVRTVVVTALIKIKGGCKRLMEVVDHQEYEHLLMTEDNPQTLAERADLLQMLEKLPFRERIVIEDFLDHVNQDATARSLGVVRSRVAQLKKSGLQKLKKMLQ